MNADIPKVNLATCEQCHGVLERLPEIYFYPRKAFLGCRHCNIVMKCDILDMGVLENPKPHGTYKGYQKQLAERETGIV